MDHTLRFTYTTDDDGVWFECTVCGKYIVNLGFQAGLAEAVETAKKLAGQCGDTGNKP